MIAFKEPTNLFTNSVTEITTQNTVQSSSEASASSSTPASPQQPPIIANRSKTPFPDIPLTHYYSAIFSVPNHQTQSSDSIKAELDKEWANIITLRTRARSGSQVVQKNGYSEKNNFTKTTDISKQNEIKVSLQVNENKSPEYFYNLGLAYSKGTGVDQNDTVAFSYFFQAAAQGHAKAQFYLALMYKRGQGVDQDFRKAAELYSKAAMQGGAYALFNLARMYQKGEGVDQDLRKAAELYTKAAMQGSADAQNNLARMYQKGEGVNQDLCKAADLYTKASAQGHAKSQFYLALMYREGQGVDKDMSKAIELFVDAANAGHKESQFALSKIYFLGTGLKKDINVATLWLLRYGLSDDKKTITIAKNTDFELIQNIPDVLHTSPDFQDVTSLIFLTLPYQARGQMGALFAELIQCYPNLKRLEAPNYNITDAEALVIKSSLSSNTELRHLKINYTDLDRTTNVLNKLKIQASKKLPKIFGPDKSIKSQLLATVQQNKDLLELRNYLFKYLKAMDKNSSTRWFDEMPSDIVNIVANQFILTNLKNGYGKQASKDGLDEFLLSLQKNNLTMNTH